MSENCELCEKPAAKYTWKGHRLCSGCQNVASKINSSPEVAARIYAMVHGVELREVAAQQMAGHVSVVDEYCLERMDQIAQVVGVGSASDLVAAVRTVVNERDSALLEIDRLVNAVGDTSLRCDPHSCEKLKYAMAVIMDVADSLRSIGIETDKPGELAGAMRELAGKIMAMEDKAKGRTAPDGYDDLHNVFALAMEQAASGKGVDRHGSAAPLAEQVGCTVDRLIGGGFLVGQAVKKIVESRRLSGRAAFDEILGAINYLGMEGMRMISEKRVQETGIMGEGTVVFKSCCSSST